MSRRCAFVTVMQRGPRAEASWPPPGVGRLAWGGAGSLAGVVSTPADPAGPGGGFPGQDLGLPEQGRGSLASWRSRVAALVLDWAACMAVAVGFFGTGVLTGGGWRAWMILTVFFVQSTLLSWLAGGSFGQLICRIAVFRLRPPAARAAPRRAPGRPGLASPSRRWSSGRTAAGCRTWPPAPWSSTAAEPWVLGRPFDRLREQGFDKLRDPSTGSGSGPLRGSVDELGRGQPRLLESVEVRCGVAQVTLQVCEPGVVGCRLRHVGVDAGDLGRPAWSSATRSGTSPSSPAAPHRTRSSE